MHPTVCFDDGDPAQQERVHAAFDNVLALGLSLSGTNTGEHGVGTTKLDWLERDIGPVALDVHRSIKAALDPAGLLNSGTVFRAAGSPANLCG
jgi:glycolate dehydrogenase FAD-linked subunit